MMLKASQEGRGNSFWLISCYSGRRAIHDWIISNFSLLMKMIG